MKKFLIIFFLIGYQQSNSQNIDFFRSFDSKGQDFMQHSLLTFSNNTLLFGVRATDTISPADYLNEIYLHNIDDNGNLNWSSYFKPLDTVSTSEIKIFKTFIQDSICIIVGQCFLSNINSSVYFYTNFNLVSKKFASYNLGSTNSFSLSGINVENGNLILIKSIGIDTVEFTRINIVSNSIKNKQIVLPIASNNYYMNHFYSVEDSISTDNTIFVKIYKIDTNATIVSSKVLNTNLKVLSSGYSSVSLTNKNGAFFVEGSYELNTSNPSIPGNELDYFLYKIDPNTLQQIQFFIFSNQFPNAVKSKQEVKFDNYGDKTLIIAKVINDNNLRNVHLFLLNNSGIVWSKKLTEPSSSQFHKRFIQSMIINNNNFVSVMSAISGEITFLNYTLNGSKIDSFEVMLDTNSKSLDVVDAILNSSNYTISLTGSHVLKNEFKRRLYLSSLGFVKSYINTKANNSISIFPNPASSFTTINIDKINTVCLYNSLGELVKVYYNTSTLNIEQLQQGVYMLRILANSKDIYTSKLIVNR